MSSNAFRTPEYVMAQVLVPPHSIPGKDYGHRNTRGRLFFSHMVNFWQEIYCLTTVIGIEVFLILILFLIENKVLFLKYSDHLFPSLNFSKILSTSLLSQFHTFIISSKKTYRQIKRKNKDKRHKPTNKIK